MPRCLWNISSLSRKYLLKSRHCSQRHCSQRYCSQPKVLAVLLSFFVGFFVQIASAQDSTAVSGVRIFPPSTLQQRAISFDADGKIMRMTWEMEKYFSILRTYPNLYEAQLFQTGDTAYTIEATHFVNGKLERELKPLSLMEFSRIRYETSEAVRSSGMYINEERTAVWEDWAVGVGTGYYGIRSAQFRYIYRYFAVPGEPVWLPYWWVPGVVSTGTYIWAVHQPWFNRSASTLWSNGLLQGTVHGFATYLLAAPSLRNQYDFAAAGAIGGCLEAGVGLMLSQVLNLSTKQTQLISSLSESGIVTAMYSLRASNSREPLPNFIVDILGRDERLIGASILASSAIGIWLGNTMGQSRDLTGGDATVFTTPARLFSIAPISLLSLFSGNLSNGNKQIISGIAAGSIIAGNVLGYELVRTKDFSFQQGRVISLATYGGISAGYYLPFALFNLFRSPRPTGWQVGYTSAESLGLGIAQTIVAIVGGATGFTIPYLIYSKEAEEQHSRRLVATGAQTFNGALPLSRPIPHEPTWLENLAANTDVQFSPLGLLPLLNPTMVPGLGLGAMNMGLPIMSIRTTFGASNPQTFTDEQR